MALTTRCLAALLFMLGAAYSFAQDVGRVQFTSGTVQVERDGQRLTLRAADGVRRGDVLVTGADGLVQLSMVDHAHISLRPGSRMRIDEYSYDVARPAEGESLVSLLVGAMRTFTGEIVTRRKDRAHMKTPLASVGIRGSGNILAHSDETGTINHTLTGAHSVTSLVNGYERTLVSYPGQTIQVLPGQAPRFIPTPPAILAAAAPVSRSASSGGGSSSDSTSTAAAASSGGTAGDPSGTAAGTGSGAGGSSGSGTGTGTGTEPTAAANAAAATSPPTSPTNTSGTSAALTGPSTTGNANTSGSQASTAATTNPATTLADYETVLRFYTPLSGGYAGVLGNAAALDGGTAVFDSAGRLTRLDGATVGTFVSGPGGTPPGYSDATYNGTVTFTGGQHADAFRSSDGSVTLGRWTGGQVAIDNGAGNQASFDLGPRSLAYAVTVLAPSSALGAFTGTSTYTLAAATAPTDAAGHLGTVTSATMTANFGAHTIAGNIALSINGGNYSLAGTSGLEPGSPHFTFASSTSTLVINCSGSCSSNGYLGTVNGAFGGPAGQWMGINYRINPNRANNAPYSDFVIGALALTAPQPPKALRITGAFYMPPRPAALMPPMALAGPRADIRRVR